MKTTLLHEKDVTRKWHLVDASDKSLGRLAVELANILRGKTKPTYAPHIDGGDFVVVINAEKVKLTGMKEEQKIYQKYTGYLSGRKTATAAYVRKNKPEMIITQAVKGMLPRNHISRHFLKRLKVYAGEKHPHEAQNPEALELTI